MLRTLCDYHPMLQLREEEVWVKACVESALAGVEARQHDDGSRPGMHDLDLWRGGERFGAVEVTAATHSDSEELSSIANSGGRWSEPGLSHVRLVWVSPGTSYKTLRESLPGLLARVEGQPEGAEAVARRPLDLRRRP